MVCRSPKSASSAARRTQTHKHGRFQTLGHELRHFALRKAHRRSARLPLSIFPFRQHSIRCWHAAYAALKGVDSAACTFAAPAGAAFWHAAVCLPPASLSIFALAPVRRRRSSSPPLSRIFAIPRAIRCRCRQTPPLPHAIAAAQDMGGHIGQANKQEEGRAWGSTLQACR